MMSRSARLISVESVIKSYNIFDAARVSPLPFNLQVTFWGCETSAENGVEWGQPNTFKKSSLQLLLQLRPQSSQMPCSRYGSREAVDEILSVAFHLQLMLSVGSYSDSMQIGLAISGGVDSMALGALCSRLQDPSHWSLRLVTEGQRPEVRSLSALKFRAFIVDHDLRAGSDLEAEAVSKILEGRGNIFQITLQLISD
jgi:hypothetical protein